MTPPPAVRSREWWTRPSVVLPIVVTVALLVALLTPQAASGRFGDPRLSSHLSGSLGARVLADMARRLGWRVVSRDSVAAPLRADGRTIHAVLAPVTPVTPAETRQYLDAVRAGDALLLVLGDARTPLSDSLGVTRFTRGGILPSPALAREECGDRHDMTPALWADGRVHLYGVRWLRSAPPERVAFAPLDHDEAGAPPRADAAVGFALGRGRVVVAADPDLLRNDVLRHCVWGADVIAVNMLEWLRADGPAPRTTLAFDEYHQGFGSRQTVLGVVASFLMDHPIGRALLLGVAAGLVLLLAVAPRAILPQEVERIERRDPLEQVDALAHAYEQVRATRTATARLLHGMRWRVEHGTGARSRVDDAFLESAAARAPLLCDDVTLVKRALRASVADRELPEVGAALRRIEHTLTTPDT